MFNAVIGSMLLFMPWLTTDDLRHFASEGYVLLRGVVPEALLAGADAEIDAFIADVNPDDGNRGPGQNAWFTASNKLPRCDDVLRRSPALAIARELVAPNALDHAHEDIQIATTVPPWSHIPGGPHIDGHGEGQDPPYSFTMLVGVLLTDQHQTQSGNLWVWPGSHLDHERLFRERGARVLMGKGGHASMLDPPISLRPPIPITGGRGDLLLAHFLLGHNKGGNTASHHRRTIYYRLSVPGHAQRWEQTFLDAWTEYPAVRTVVNSARTA